ncbi:hypothetical protein PMI36_00827 [Pseudomonas sp. GM79]|nr:hypothetical protein PMI36_00827 [Pseudomonas sp. GM79]
MTPRGALRSRSDVRCEDAENGHRRVAEEINRHIQQIYDEARLVESLANSAQEDSGWLSLLSNELNGLVGRFKS